MINFLYLLFDKSRENIAKRQEAKADDRAKNRAISNNWETYIDTSGKTRFVGGANMCTVLGDEYTSYKNVSTGKIVSCPMEKTIGRQVKAVKCMALNGKLNESQCLLPVYAPDKNSYYAFMHRKVDIKFYDLYSGVYVYVIKYKGILYAVDYIKGKILRSLESITDYSDAKEYNDMVQKITDCYRGDFLNANHKTFNNYRYNDNYISLYSKKYGSEYMIETKFVPDKYKIYVNINDTMKLHKELFGKEIFDE